MEQKSDELIIAERKADEMELALWMSRLETIQAQGQLLNANHAQCQQKVQELRAKLAPPTLATSETTDPPPDGSGGGPGNPPPPPPPNPN